MRYLSRIFIPSWRFYEDVKFKVFLFYRFKRVEWSEYQKWNFKFKPTVWNLFVNPYGNRNLLINTLCYRSIFESSIENHPTKSVKKLEKILRLKILSSNEKNSVSYFQFKICTVDIQKTKYEDALVSDEISIL